MVRGDCNNFTFLANNGRTLRVYKESPAKYQLMPNFFDQIGAKVAWHLKVKND